MSTTFADHLNEDRRLVILRALEGCNEYTGNAFLLRRFCDRVGHAVSADRLQTDLNWLAEQGLVKAEQREGVTVATLTLRGLDVATGRATAPGVQRPQPAA